MSPLTGNIKTDIQELINANKSKPNGKKRPMKQIEAIAYATNRKIRGKK